MVVNLPSFTNLTFMYTSIKTTLITQNIFAEMIEIKYALQ